MDGTALQARIYRGYAIAAAHIGLSYDFYRPSSSTSPLAVGNKYQSAPAAFDPDQRFVKPNGYNKPIWFGTFDGTASQVGDYVTGHGRTFFIISQQALLPIQCVDCNRTVSVLRAQTPSGVGALGYGGSTAANETTLMGGWPASILELAKGTRDAVKLPGDTMNPNFTVLLPAFSGVTIFSRDAISDDLGLRYDVTAAELTDLGWRLLVTLADT